MATVFAVTEVMRIQIGQRLRAARERAELSQAEVCRRTALGESTLSELENDRRSPSLAQLDLLARTYARSVASFLSDAEAATTTVLWRKRPAEGAEELEAKFLRLIEQYANLERWCNDVASCRIPDVQKPPQAFCVADAEELARVVRRDLGLGDRPALSLLRVLEEECGVKLFHLPFEPTGTAACARSDDYGIAILLNSKNVRWRRNFDLAHELFHVLTWNIFRPESPSGGEREEQLADAFASTLLLPEEALRSALNRRRIEKKLSTAAVFDLARDFDVSIDAIVWRLHTLFGVKDRGYTKQRIDAFRAAAPLYEERTKDVPPTRPERFHALAVTAIRSGDLAIGRFAEYLGITRGEAMKFVEQEAPLDEAMELPAS